MCGFTGYVGQCNCDKEIVGKMMQKIVHRGPDSQDSFVDNDAALGFVRLSIIDLNNGSQPMENEDGSLVLVFNGEIYNYQSIRKDLIEAGHIFKTNTDSEILLHGYEEYGTSLLNKLRGMFAFTIWDKNKKKLFGARDFFGIKPYYYSQMGDVFFFGSEIKSFIPHPAFKMELNEDKLPDYLTFGCIPGADTMFKNVYKLPPAHYYEYENGKLSINRYFQPQFKPDDDKSMEQFVDEIEDTFRKSVEAHKIADVEVGCFLSAGVDSSYVACELSKIQKVKTFTVGFNDFEQSEAGAAANLAKEIGVENYSKIINAEEYFSSVPKVQYHMDEPLGNPSANNLFFVSQRAAEDLKVVLSGEGADEMFGGYNVYKEPLTISKYQHRVPRVIRKGLGGIASKLPDFKGRNFFIRGSKSIEERYIGNSYVFEVGERDEYLKSSYESQPPQWFTSKYYKEAKDYDDITKMQYLDIHGWMVQEILLKADKMSMSQSLELRVPFLDKEIFALSSTIPTKYRVSKENTKLAMRMAANRQMNSYSANRKKAAFPTPLPEWLREDKYYYMVKEAFTSENAAKYFNTEKLVWLLDEHRQGKRFLTHKIWVLYCFLVWYDDYFVKNGEV